MRRATSIEISGVAVAYGRDPGREKRRWRVTERRVRVTVQPRFFYFGYSEREHDYHTKCKNRIIVFVRSTATPRTFGFGIDNRSSRTRRKRRAVGGPRRRASRVERDACTQPQLCRIQSVSGVRRREGRRVFTMMNDLGV